MSPSVDCWTLTSSRCASNSTYSTRRNYLPLGSSSPTQPQRNSLVMPYSPMGSLRACSIHPRNWRVVVVWSCFRLGYSRPPACISKALAFLRPPPLPPTRLYPELLRITVQPSVTRLLGRRLLPDSLIHIPNHQPPVHAPRRSERPVRAVRDALQGPQLPLPGVHLLERGQVVDLHQRRPTVDDRHRFAVRVERER